MKRFAALVIVVLAALALSLSRVAPVSAEGQQGTGEHLASGHFSVSTAAVVATYSSTAGPRIVIKEMYLTSETAGLVTFHDGTTGTGATRVGIANFYLVANTPTPIPTNLFRDKPESRLTDGNSLYAQGPGVLHFDITYTTH